MSKKDPFLSKITDMRILPSKIPFSAIFGTLMRTIYRTKCRYWVSQSVNLKLKNPVCKLHSYFEAENILLLQFIPIMRVSKFQSIRTSRYICEKRKCCSYSALTPMRGFPALIGISQQKLMTLFEFRGPKPNFFSHTISALDQYLKNDSENTILLQ